MRIKDRAMDNETLEKRLKAAWNPTPPDGMRERVLTKAMNELPKPARPGIFTWRVALSMAAVVVVIGCNLLDNHWMGGANLPPASSQMYQALRSRAELARALSDTDYHNAGGYYR